MTKKRKKDFKKRNRIDRFVSNLACQLYRVKSFRVNFMNSTNQNLGDFFMFFRPENFFSKTLKMTHYRGTCVSRQEKFEASNFFIEMLIIWGVLGMWDTNPKEFLISLGTPTRTGYPTLPLTKG
jgi:hypothetical protein